MKMQSEQPLLETSAARPPSANPILKERNAKIEIARLKRKKKKGKTKGGGSPYLSQRLKPQMMSLNSLYLMVPRETSIPIHDKRHMLRNRPFSQRPNQQLPEM